MEVQTCWKTDNKFIVVDDRIYIDSDSIYGNERLKNTGKSLIQVSVFIQDGPNKVMSDIGEKIGTEIDSFISCKKMLEVIFFIPQYKHDKVLKTLEEHKDVVFYKVIPYTD